MAAVVDAAMMAAGAAALSAVRMGVQGPQQTGEKLRAAIDQLASTRAACTSRSASSAFLLTSAAARSASAASRLCFDC